MIIHKKTSTLTERKNKISTIYDGYVFQLYAQYFCMIEQGFTVKYLKLYSYSDNKSYSIKLPEDDFEMFRKFNNLISNIANFDLINFLIL